MVQMVQSLPGMFSDLREMGLQPFGTGFDSFRLRTQSHLSASHPKGVGHVGNSERQQNGSHLRPG